MSICEIGALIRKTLIGVGVSYFELARVMTTTSIPALLKEVYVIMRGLFFCYITLVLLDYLR